MLRPPGPRRTLLAGIGAALWLASGCGDLSFPGGAAARPNLLLVTVDTLRADRLGCYGGEPAVGALLCGLADTGTRFEWVLSTAPYTAPSVASILTGLYPSAHGVTQTATSYLRAEVETVAERLQAAGYDTAAFVSNPILERSHRLDQGFLVYDQEMRREERNRPDMVERVAQSTTDAALAWAQSRAQAPWFLWVHFQDPHGPYDPPGAPAIRDRPGERRLPVLVDHSGRDGIPAYQALPGVFTERAYAQRYRAEIEYLDRHLGRLVRGLDEFADPPAILLTADHGEAFGEDGYYFAHGHSVGLDQIRVPLLWRPATPGVARVESLPVSLIDVGPTLLRAARVEIPEHWPGQPLPLFGAGSAPEARRAIFAEHSRRAAVVVGRSYYARNRRKVAPDEYDPNSGGRARLLPARTAQLGPAGDVPAYGPATGSAVDRKLARTLAEFLRDAQRQRAGAARGDVPEETRRRLRALGYAN